MDNLVTEIFIEVGIGALLLGITVGCLVFAIMLVLRKASRTRLLDERVAPYTETTLQEDRSGTLAATFSEWLTRSEVGRRIILMAEEADVGYSAGRLMLYTIVLSGMLGVFAQILGGGILLSLLCIGVGLVIPYFWLEQQSEKRLEKILGQLPDSLLVIANALSAGASMVQAIENSVDELPRPINYEYKRIAEEVRVGRSLEEALMNFRKRVPLTELDSLIASILIQRRSGGNLADLMNEMSEILKEDVKMKQEMMVQTSQARMSARVVGLAPIALFIMMYFVNPAYITPMTSSTLGVVMLIIAFILEIVGFYVIQRITVIEV
ncbi:MAG: type II secretion system F family protein [Chloroflexota bacterium]